MKNFTKLAAIYNFVFAFAYQMWHEANMPVEYRAQGIFLVGISFALIYLMIRDNPLT